MHCSFAGKLIKIMKIKVDFFVTYIVIINNLLALPVSNNKSYSWIRRYIYFFFSFLLV